MIGAEVSWWRLSSDGAIEHPTYGYAVDVSTFDAKTDDAAGEHVHYQQHPVTMQENGFAAEQVDASQAIFDVPDECQPRRTVGSGIAWPVVLPEHASNDVLVKLDAEGVSDLLGDAYATEPWIAALQLDDRRDEFGGRAFRAGFAAMRRGRKE